MFDWSNIEPFGIVESVDTSKIIVVVDEDRINRLQINQLVAIQSPKAGQTLIGLISRITRKRCYISSLDLDDEKDAQEESIENLCSILLIGTLLQREGVSSNVFKRTLTSVPEIEAKCAVIVDEQLTNFMRTISYQSTDEAKVLSIGNYIIDDEAEAWLNGDKFFQRHAVIVGSTGSGKSWTVAKILDEMVKLPSANAILFDIHGEYTPLQGNGYEHYKIAGPSDMPSSDILFLPYWLLTYEEMLAFIIDRSDQNAPNQASAFHTQVIEKKKEYLQTNDILEDYKDFTVDSPIPFSLDLAIESLNQKDIEMVSGSNSRPKQGPLHGRLTRFIQRLSAKKDDKRLNFLFSSDENVFNIKYMNSLCKNILMPCNNGNGGIKVINFSEVPSDILPLMVSLMARIIFYVQQWTKKEERNPIAIFCDEAHLYISNHPKHSIESISLESFERIAKEGRKYGIGLVVVSQRPSEVNRTVLSQCNNFIAMRLTNTDDQNVIKRLFPDSLGDFSEMLPILDIGEAIIVGDSCLLPSRIRINKPEHKPDSATVDFWTEWNKDSIHNSIDPAIKALRKQSRG